MNVTLYTTHCPKCRVLEAKLNSKKVDFNIIDNEELMIEKGFQSAPMLEVDDNVMNFGEAIKWVNSMAK